MVLWDSDPRKTRWAPFPHNDDLPIMRTQDLDQGGTPYWANNTEALEMAVPAFTMAIKDRDEEMVSWARGKVALFVGE